MTLVSAAMTIDGYNHSAVLPAHQQLEQFTLSRAAAKSAAAPYSRRRRESHQRIVDLTQSLSRYQISEPQASSQRHNLTELSYFDIPSSSSSGDSPAVSPLSRAPAVQLPEHLPPPRSWRDSRSPSPEWAVPNSSRPSARALREQRIRNSRLMTDDRHRREVAALVERMVDERSQCQVHVRTASAASSSAASSVALSPTATRSSASTAASSASASPVLGYDACGDMDCGAESDSAVDYPSKTLTFRRSGDLAAMVPAGVVKRDVRVRKQRRQRASGGSGRPWEV